MRYWLSPNREPGPYPEWKKRKAYSLGIQKQQTGSWGESDRGGIRLWEKVYKEWGRWKSCSVEIG